MQKHFPHEKDAVDELMRRRSSDEYKGMLSKMRPSSYGGFIVVSLPTDIVVNDLINSNQIGLAGKFFSGSAMGYNR